MSIDSLSFQLLRIVNGSVHRSVHESVRLHRGWVPATSTANRCNATIGFSFERLEHLYVLVIISPAKTLDFDTPPTTDAYSMPAFMKESKQLVKRLREFAPQDLSDLMKISSKLGQLNYDRYASWNPKFTTANAKPAALAFKGDVYQGLGAETLDQRDLNWAQKRVRILSGLYGLLKPLDLMQPYRLEMGTRLSVNGTQDLYQFWGNKLTDALNDELATLRPKILVNLASNEYYGAVQPDRIVGRIITPTFLDRKNGEYKFVSFFAKKARGTMTRYIVRERVGSLKALQAFNDDGYRFSEERSSDDNWVFLRD